MDDFGKTPAKHQRNFQELEQRRMQAAKLLSREVSQSEVARQLGVSRQSVSRWARQIKLVGRRGLRAAGRAGRKPRLSEQNQKDKSAAVKRGPKALGYATGGWSLPRLKHLIQSEAGIRYDPSQVSRIMRRMGWRREMPPRFVNDKPRLWRRLSYRFRDVRTDKIAAMMLRFKGKPIESWSSKDRGLLDVLDEILYDRSTRRISRVDGPRINSGEVEGMPTAEAHPGRAV